MFSTAIDIQSRQILKKIGKIPLISRFYLTGTACTALHIRHMEATTLEFFTEADYFEQEPFIGQLHHTGKIKVQKQSPGSLSVRIDNTPVLFTTHPFPLLEPAKKLSDVRISGLLDCALATIIENSRQGTIQNFIDLYFILKHGSHLRELLWRIPEKYYTYTYSTYQLLRSLVWFEDADKDIPLVLKQKLDWPHAKAYFRKEVKSLMQDYFE